MRSATGDVSDFLLLMQRQRDRTGQNELLENFACFRITMKADLTVVVQTETEQLVIGTFGFGGNQREAVSGGDV